MKTFSALNRILPVVLAVAAQSGLPDAPVQTSDIAGPATNWSADCTPNYADRMLSPIPDSAYVPTLVPIRTRRPVRVCVLDDGTYCDDSLSAIVAQSCAKWEYATKSVPEGGAVFAVTTAKNPLGADVVVQFCNARAIDGDRGLTVEQAGWAWVRVACQRSNGNALPAAEIQRATTHEIGHAMGIWGHSPDSRDVMSLNVAPTEITVADVNTLRLAYLRRRMF